MSKRELKKTLACVGFQLKGLVDSIPVLFNNTRVETNALKHLYTVKCGDRLSAVCRSAFFGDRQRGSAMEGVGEN